MLLLEILHNLVSKTVTLKKKANSLQYTYIPFSNFTYISSLCVCARVCDFISNHRGRKLRPGFQAAICNSPAQVTHFWAFFTSAYREGGDYERNNVPKDGIIYRCAPFFVDLALLRLATREENSRQENNLGFSEIHSVKKWPVKPVKKSNICKTSECPDLLVSFQGAPNSGGCALVLFHPSAAQVVWYRRYVCNAIVGVFLLLIKGTIAHWVALDSLPSARQFTCLRWCKLVVLNWWRHIFYFSWSVTQIHTTLNFILQK